MTLVVLHDLGDPVGGQAWRDAAAAHGFDDVWIPDLAGHGHTPAPTGGNYTRVDPAYAVARAVVDGLELDRSIMVGVGRSGWAAMAIATAGQGAGLVLVDGLGTPWIPLAERSARRRARTRTLALDARSITAPPATGLDPRVAASQFPHGDEALVRDAAASIEIPTLLIGAEHEAAAAVAGGFAGPATVIGCTPEPKTVVAHMTAWLSDL